MLLPAKAGPSVFRSAVEQSRIPSDDVPYHFAPMPAAPGCTKGLADGEMGRTRRRQARHRRHMYGAPSGWRVTACREQLPCPPTPSCHGSPGQPVKDGACFIATSSATVYLSVNHDAWFTSHRTYIGGNYPSPPTLRGAVVPSASPSLSLFPVILLHVYPATLLPATPESSATHNASLSFVHTQVRTLSPPPHIILKERRIELSRQRFQASLSQIDDVSQQG